MESNFAKEKIVKTITCTQACALEEKHGIGRSEISAYCNRHGIRIHSCQLG